MISKYIQLIVIVIIDVGYQYLFFIFLCIFMTAPFFFIFQKIFLWVYIKKLKIMFHISSSFIFYYWAAHSLNLHTKIETNTHNKMMFLMSNKLIYHHG